MKLTVNLGKDSYDINVCRGGLSKIGEYFNLSRKVLIVTDSGVPSEYAKLASESCTEPFIEVFPEGERSKNTETYLKILGRLVEEKFTRSDCVIALGGGVTGDMAGFAASTYMRGIDFYNIPTTLLSQLDSSIGGKVAIDFMGYKNIVGAFYQPKGVLIDSDLLDTLPPRQISNGVAEAIKMAATLDSELFSLIENEYKYENIEEIIIKSLQIKKRVVEVDVCERGMRKVLNFGHTIGHAIESVYGVDSLYHGECVSLGMLAITGGEIRERLARALARAGLPTSFDYDREKVMSALSMDKKKSGKSITVVMVDKIGEFRLEDMKYEDFLKEMESRL